MEEEIREKKRKQYKEVYFIGFFIFAAYYCVH